MLRSLALLGALLAVPRPVRAQSAEDKAAAQALFDEARRLLKGGKVAEACEKLRTSQGLDPAAGTLLNLGDCYERLGKTASAWATFKEAASMARRISDERKAKEAQKRAAALERILARVAIEVAAPNRAAHVAVTLDGRNVAEATWGTPVPLDPGSHEVGASAPGREPWKQTVEAKGGETARVEVPPLGEAKTTGGASGMAAVDSDPEGPSGATPAAAPPAAPDEPARPGAGLRTAGIVTGAAGVALIGGGVWFGLQAKKKADAIEALSTTEPNPDAWDEGLKKDGERAQLLMYACTGAGVAALGTGVLLFWLGHRAAESAEVGFVPGGAILSVEAHF